MKYIIQTEQSFDVTFEVRADSEDEAWDLLKSDSPVGVECLDQSPGSIIGSREDSYIEVSP